MSNEKPSFFTSFYTNLAAPAVHLKAIGQGIWSIMSFIGKVCGEVTGTNTF